jgi:hypothetical protein
VALENIADNSITSATIKDENIGTIDLADNSITSEKIVDENITAADIATGAVTTSEILNGTILTEDLANNAVTYDKMAIKIKCGLATNVVHGSTVNHGLGVIPTSIVATPVYNSNIEVGMAVLHVNIDNVTANSFDVALWIEVEGGLHLPPVVLDKVDGVFWPPENIYWIAIYLP